MKIKLKKCLISSKKKKSSRCPSVVSSVRLQRRGRRRRGRLLQGDGGTRCAAALRRSQPGHVTTDWTLGLL